MPQYIFCTITFVLCDLALSAATYNAVALCRANELTFFFCLCFIDCMECMACSDNVVRAGLTPKYIDVPTLCSMLNYECKPASNNLFTPRQHPNDNSVTVYDPPVPDFTVARIKVSDEVEQHSHFLFVPI